MLQILSFIFILRSWTSCNI